jgi:flagellar protein FliS
MSFTPHSAAAYARVSVESGVDSAGPHRLIAMLFDGALLQIGRARSAMQARDFAAKGAACSKAIQIVEQGLRASLDEAAGGELALQLRLLYEYIAQRILQASAGNDARLLEEPARLLRDLQDAWQTIRG